MVDGGCILSHRWLGYAGMMIPRDFFQRLKRSPRHEWKDKCYTTNDIVWGSQDRYNLKILRRFLIPPAWSWSSDSGHNLRDAGLQVLAPAVAVGFGCNLNTLNLQNIQRERESQKAFEKIGRKIHDKNNWISGTYPENTRKIAGFGCCHGLPSRWVPATPIEIQSLKISERRWYNWLVVWNMTFMTSYFLEG